MSDLVGKVEDRLIISHEAHIYNNRLGTIGIFVCEKSRMISKCRKRQRILQNSVLHKKPKHFFLTFKTNFTFDFCQEI